MSAPVGWDEKSWADVCKAEEMLRGELDHLRSLLGQEDADAERIDAAFTNMRTFADLGSMAAGWCKA